MKSDATLQLTILTKSRESNFPCNWLIQRDRATQQATQQGNMSTIWVHILSLSLSLSSTQHVKSFFQEFFGPWNMYSLDHSQIYLHMEIHVSYKGQERSRELQMPRATPETRQDLSLKAPTLELDAPDEED